MPETKNSETHTPLGKTNNQAVNSKTRHSCCLEGLRFPHTGCMENENNKIIMFCCLLFIGFFSGFSGLRSFFFHSPCCCSIYALLFRLPLKIVPGAFVLSVFSRWFSLRCSAAILFPRGAKNLCYGNVVLFG